MTMRSSGAVLRRVRRSFQDAFGNCNSSPCPLLDFTHPVSRISLGVDRFRFERPQRLPQTCDIKTMSCSEIGENREYMELPSRLGLERGRQSSVISIFVNLSARRDLHFTSPRLGLERVYQSSITVGSLPFNHQLLRKLHFTTSGIVDRGRWIRISRTLGPSCIRHPFLEGSIRFKSKKKMKKAKAKKKEVLQKIKRMRIVSQKRKEDMTPEERLEFRLLKGRKKMELIQQAIAKFPEQEIPPEDPDVEVLSAEQMHYLKKIGYKNKNYVPVGKRGIYGGTVQNIHMHWKKHETVQVEIAGFSKEEIKVMAVQLARLSGGILIDIHQKNIVILYRGRNYKMPKQLIPMKTLDKRKALAKSKLEQALKALVENDKKVEAELADLRKELAKNPALQNSKSANNSEGQPRLEDPDEYSEWSDTEDEDEDLLRGLDEDEEEEEEEEEEEDEKEEKEKEKEEDSVRLS